MTTDPSWREGTSWARLARPALVALVIAGFGLAGCGGPSRAQRDAVAAAQVRAQQARAIAEQAGLAPDVGDFLARAAGAGGQRYTAAYNSGAGQQTTVISRPPDRQVDVQGVSGSDSLDRFIVKGGKSYTCHRGGGKWTCQEGAGAGAPGGFTSDTVTQTVAALTQLSASYNFTISHRKIVRLDATCLAVDRRPGQRADSTFGDHGELCIAPNGVILEEDAVGSPLRAISYRSTVPSGAFSLPAKPTPAPK